ncbi:hypothetical protein M413DRAFT_62143 [Hebeloma cylindrosporum]|uniref:Palmitoyltransferase PFA4 n=1 Tax=Hebeloma cylindrosporum TaxID=76867 RepID=A0A0C2YCB9_HEBCY|nr:hypothetical protein M413DRAFT_62143 [Hebeloma cylindrosporum h7]
MHPFFGRLFVNFVLCLICFIAYSSQIFIIWPWYGNVISVELVTLLFPFNVFVGLLLWNYFLCVFTDPGRVPTGWKPDTHADGYEVKKLTGAPRYCRMCQNYKPPRSHHCRQCNRCVLRMDHHCPWINNCVGHFNYGHFIRFLFFVDIACSYHLAMITKRVFYSMGTRYWRNFQDEPSTLELIMIIMNYVACGPVLLIVGGFSLYHFYTLLSNTTTIEGWEKDKISVMVKRGEAREVKFPYDLGKRRNIESVLGPDPIRWCCPTRTPGSGLKYELSNSEGHAWLPQDSVSESSSEPSEPLKHSSPWTYENEFLNPTLTPSNSQIRASGTRRRRTTKGAIHADSSSFPSHPDYQEQYESEEHSGTSEASVDEHYPQRPGQLRVRRRSEGYEVRPAGREEMLQRYLENLGEEPGRYLRYIPQVEDESDLEDEDDDNVPLASHTQRVAGLGQYPIPS